MIASLSGRRSELKTLLWRVTSDYKTWASSTVSVGLLVSGFSENHQTGQIPRKPGQLSCHHCCELQTKKDSYMPVPCGAMAHTCKLYAYFSFPFLNSTTLSLLKRRQSAFFCVPLNSISASAQPTAYTKCWTPTCLQAANAAKLKAVSRPSLRFLISKSRSKDTIAMEVTLFYFPISGAVKVLCFVYLLILTNR